ncbi:Crp/Fnr family transcriptional regulator [Actinoplanes sp. DH11]|uniref:Crp/Fnr family transcriptional regulator n=1 Tax=Actinoplanes sp. DH11 TaxID=2857011 RepID=UPI001E61066E|nr:Crp/Fnr family transcriptional regulator [Actinoplanes sp. DH11]
MEEPFWYALTEPQRADLLRIGTRRVFAAETVIVREQEASDFAVVVLDGCVKVCTYATHGYQVILGLRDAGDLLGELAGIDGGLRSATLCALTEVDALLLPGPAFRELLRAFPDAAALVQRTVSARLREADRYRAAAGAQTSPQRLAALLLSLGRRYGVAAQDGALLIELPLSQQDLAGLILASHRTLGRLLEQFRDQGMVATGRRSLLLLDLPALRAVAAG